MKIRTAIYARPCVAIASSLEDQVADLKKLAADHGASDATVFTDTGLVSGRASSRNTGFNALSRGIKLGAYDTLLIHTIHLAGRNVSELIAMLTAMKEANVRLISKTENLDDGAGHDLLTVAALLADYIKFGRRERILEGHARARERGVRIGRPSLPERTTARVIEGLEAGRGIREVSRLAGVGAASVLRIRDSRKDGAKT